MHVQACSQTAVFTTTKRKTEPKCLPTDEQKNKLWYVNTIESFKQRKNLRKHMPSERSKNLQKATYYTILLCARYRIGKKTGW